MIFELNCGLVKIESKELQISELGVEIIRSLAYFHVFSYPLNGVEIGYCVPGGFNNQLELELKRLVKAKVLFEKKGLFLLEKCEEWVDKRIRGNKLAAKKMKSAGKISRFIAWFPFVRGVMISGTLSKGVMTPDADIDFFIITAPGRLWVARTSLVFFKKLFLLNSHKFFCVNYFVDTDSLEIEDKNLFTASEVAFLLPMVNREVYQKFTEVNQWAKIDYPGFPFREAAMIQPFRRSWVAIVMEWFLAGKLGEKLDDKLLKLTFNRWKKKFSNLQDDTFEVAMRSLKHVSKHHPGAYQQVVLKKNQEILDRLSKKYNISL